MSTVHFSPSKKFLQLSVSQKKKSSLLVPPL